MLIWYGFDPYDLSPGVRAIIISVQPDRREDYTDMADMDDEVIERRERQRELEDRRREGEARERAQFEAIQAIQAAEARYDYSGYPIDE